MKKSIIATLAVSAISTLGSSAAFAHEDYSERGTLHSGPPHSECIFPDRIST